MTYRRFSTEEMTLDDLFELLTDDRYDLFFCVFIKNNQPYRYKLPEIKNIQDLEKMINNNLLKKFEPGVNSGDVNVLEADYIDCYFK